jgi:hypothetical protein
MSAAQPQAPLYPQAIGGDIDSFRRIATWVAVASLGMDLSVSAASAVPVTNNTNVDCSNNLLSINGTGFGTSPKGDAQ